MKKSYLIIFFINYCSSFIHNSIFNRINSFTNKNNKNNNDISIDKNYNLNWYVVDESYNFPKNVLKKVTVWDNDYVIWKDDNNKYHALENDCRHRGASLAQGKLLNSCVSCPYHGYEFNTNGTLVKVPGLNFNSSSCKNQDAHNIIERNGWVYLNTIPKNILHEDTKINIFEEPESNDLSFTYININLDFKAYARIVSENSLDIMHIGFVHTFGNKKTPNPLHETPPFLMDDYDHHYRTEYLYYSGEDSIAKKLYGIDKVLVQNEFILPHTTIARVIFDKYVNTVMTFATPINSTNSKLFIKTYRNYWNTNNSNCLEWLHNKLGDMTTIDMMVKTAIQDKAVVENIKLKNIDGKYNMKYDKLQNTYKTLYKRFIHNLTII
jgi:phenylpropionate dioxygenase-like ring-hydroxylating dioxygenase large terminal subunit